MTPDDMAIRWQTQKRYGSCQLVAATNAALYLGTIKRRPGHGQQWERLVDLTLCRAGSCLDVRSAHRYLGIEEIEIPRHLDAVRRHVRQGRPVETAVWLPWAGFHAILVLDYKPPTRKRGGLYAVLNYYKQQDGLTWISAKELGGAMLHITKGKGKMVRGYCYFKPWSTPNG